jgi:hypothetical protein
MKKIKAISLLVLLPVMVLAQNSDNNNHSSPQKTIKTSAIPSLDELSGKWLEVNTLRSFPTVMNFVGGVQASQNLTAFQNLTVPPYAQGGLSGELLLDGMTINATLSQWHPCQVLRKATVNGVELESTMRMPFEQQGVLIRLRMRNHSNKAQTLHLSIKGSGKNRLYASEKWATWGNYRPSDSNFVASVNKGGETLLIKDNSSPAVTVYSFNPRPDELIAAEGKGNASWRITLAPGKSQVIELAYAIGKDVSSVTATARKWAENFDAEFGAAKSKWESRWQMSFKPGNKFFSGHYPILITDDLKIRRVYYESALVPLLMCRINLPYSNRSFVTAGPTWANTLVYFWDAAMWPNTWASLEPKEMKEQLSKWFLQDTRNCYAVDYLSGKGSGPWYAANDWAIFSSLDAYLGVTGDTSFLKKIVNGKTMLQHLDDMATFYESRPLTKESLLANYGGPANLLECSPSYIQGVSSFNAASVYMLRRTASYYEKSGNFNRAKELRSKSEKLLPFVLALYEPGEGVWNAMDTTGKKVPIRHCFDYITVGQALEGDLSSKIKSEMNHFVETELLTKTWMRAMSFKDPAAEKSDRPDHGPLGSYDAWPALTMDVMCRFGDFDKALAFLRASEAVTHEGPYAQAHEFVGAENRGNNPLVRIASRGGQDANEVCGTAFAEVIIRSFFGFRPDLSVDKPTLLSPNVPRGFNGKLRHVSWQGKLYSIVSDAKGVHITKE